MSDATPIDPAQPAQEPGPASPPADAPAASIGPAPAPAPPVAGEAAPAVVSEVAPAVASQLPGEAAPPVVSDAAPAVASQLPSEAAPPVASEAAPAVASQLPGEAAPPPVSAVASEAAAPASSPIQAPPPPPIDQGVHAAAVVSEAVATPPAVAAMAPAVAAALPPVVSSPPPAVTPAAPPPTLPGPVTAADAGGPRIVATAAGPRVLPPVNRPAGAAPATGRIGGPVTPAPGAPATGRIGAPLPPTAGVVGASGLASLPRPDAVGASVARPAAMPPGGAPAAGPRPVAAPPAPVGGPPPAARPLAAPPAAIPPPPPMTRPAGAPAPAAAAAAPAPSPSQTDASRRVKTDRTASVGRSGRRGGTERLDRLQPSAFGGPALAAVGLAVGVVGTLAVQALRAPAPSSPEVAVATEQPAPGSDPASGSAPTDRAGRVARNERSPEQWHAWAHDEVARAWRVAAQDGHARAEGRLLAVARDVEAAAGAPDGARDVVRVAQEQLHALARGETAPSRPASPEGPRPRASGATPARPPAPAPVETKREPAGDDEEHEGPAWMPPGLEPSANEPEEARPPVGVTPEARDLQPARALLLRLYDAFYAKDTAGTRALLTELEKHGEVPETFAARGLFHFQARDYALALDALTKAGDASLQAVHDRAFSALYLGRLDVVRSLLDHEALKETKLRLLVDGPFRGRYERAADVLETRTDDGHYRVITDLGLTRGDLVGLEEKLGKEDAAGRIELAEKARRRHRGLDELCAIMSKAYKAYDKLFGPDRPGDVVPTVVVFSDRAQFDTFSARLEVGSTENTLGYYWPPYRLLVFYDMDEGDRRGGAVVSKATLQVLLHETFHQWLDLYVDEAPRWFDEGMAEYFGISELTRTELRYGLVPTDHPSRLDNIRDALSGMLPRPLPLSRLLTADYKTFMNPNQGAVNYAHAWSFVHFLGASSGGQKLLRDYFKALRDGLDQEAAYDRVFAKLDMDRLETEWRQHVGRMR